MKNRIIALLLSVVIILGLLPAQAMAASFANTAQSKKSARKMEVATSLEFYRQSLVELLDESMNYFESPNNYSSEVWNTAQNIYKTEVERINKMTSLVEMVDLGKVSFLGHTANETTIEVSLVLEGLSELDATVYKNEKDIESIKDELRTYWNDVLSKYKKADYNDFYWDRLVSSKEELYSQIDKIADCLDYARFQMYWGDIDIFESNDYDFDEYSGTMNSILYQYIVSKDEMENAVYDVQDTLYEYIEEYLPSRNYKADTENLYTIVYRFEEEALKAEYARQILDIAEKAYTDMIIITGIDPSDDLMKPQANNSDKIRLQARLDKYFFDTYSKKNYSESGWETILQIKDDYASEIDEIVYKTDLKEDKIYNDFVKELSSVKTYAQELKEYKSECVMSLKEYIGNPKYNQPKVKAIVTEGIKKINAAKKTEVVESVFGTYLKKAKATINKYKIITSKSGAGAVSASKTVNYGSSYTVKIVPKAGYKIKAIAVDGKKIKLTNAYTFKNIKKAHTIKVTFGK